MVFDAATDTVRMRTFDGETVETLSPARAAFKGMLRNSAWDAPHLGYFLGYGCWNYFTTPFLFAYPGVQAREIEPWHEAGQTLRRLAVRFPASIATHNPDQVFYFDSQGLQRRMDYIAEVNGSTLVGHYTSRYESFDGPPADECFAATPTTPSTSTCRRSPSTSTTSNSFPATNMHNPDHPPPPTTHPVAPRWRCHWDDSFCAHRR
jgi:hypothetical protein